jgi:hypothetical protein
VRSTFTYAVILLAALNVDIMFGDLFDPKTDEGKYKREVLGDSIPLENGENILLTQHHLAASSVVIVIKIAYEQMLPQLRSFVGKRLGIASEGEVIPEGHTARSSTETKEFIWAPWPVFGEDFAKLRALGMTFEQPREYEITSKRYNQIEKLSGYSVIGIRIIDGKPLFGKECVLIVLRRSDHSKEWAYMWHGIIPMPFKIAADHDLVTDTEIGLIESFLTAIKGPKARYFSPSPVYRDKEYWSEFISAITKAVKGSSEGK